MRFFFFNFIIFAKGTFFFAQNENPNDLMKSSEVSNVLSKRRMDSVYWFRSGTHHDDALKIHEI